MPSIRMVMFDLSGTTVYDDRYVSRCLHRAAAELGIDCTEEEIGRNIGTNKLDLYKMLIARMRGRVADLQQLGTVTVDAADEDLAQRAFDLYEKYMLQLYKTDLREIPGASDTFRWLHDRKIFVATDTGFHRTINNAIMDKLGWLRDGLVDVAMDVESISTHRGRPAPFMIFRAMEKLGVTSVSQVIKVGDQPADLLSGVNAGCAAVVAVLSGPLTAADLGGYRHTHMIPSVADLPALIERDFS